MNSPSSSGTCRDSISMAGSRSTTPTEPKFLFLTAARVRFSAATRIEAYLARMNVKVALEYSPARGDRFEPDYANDVHKFIFNTAGGIVVKDIPRLVGWPEPAVLNSRLEFRCCGHHGYRDSMTERRAEA